MQIEATGKSVELAIQNGLLECGKKREEVEIKVLETGGLFKSAKVALVWGEEPSAADENVAESSNETVEEGVFGEVKNIEGAEVGAVEAGKVEAGGAGAKVEEKPKRIVDTSRLEERGKEFLLGLARKVDETATVEATVGENEINFAVKGEKLGKLIGYHGENIAALQLLLSGLKLRSESPVRLYLDIDGYKFNRNQSIVDMANRVAEQAIKIERNIHLDPMSPYDRRIVHLTLQDRDDVTTESTGEGEKRHVVIKPIFKK